MYQKILLAYDGTASSLVALRQSVGLARHCQAELHLLGVVVITPSAAATGSIAGGYPVVDDFWNQNQEFLQRALDAAATDLRGQEIDVATSIRFGNPGFEIAACANELQADLVVIGHTGKGVLARLFEGSVGAELLNNLPCSLLIATGDA